MFHNTTQTKRRILQLHQKKFIQWRPTGTAQGPQVRARETSECAQRRGGERAPGAARRRNSQLGRGVLKSGGRFLRSQRENERGGSEKQVFFSPYGMIVKFIHGHAIGAEKHLFFRMIKCSSAFIDCR